MVTFIAPLADGKRLVVSGVAGVGNLGAVVSQRRLAPGWPPFDKSELPIGWRLGAGRDQVDKTHEIHYARDQVISSLLLVTASPQDQMDRPAPNSQLPAPP